MTRTLHRATRAAASALIAVIVTATAHAQGTASPRVVSTSPASEAVVPAGTTVIRVMFDQTMMANSHSYVTSQNGAFPECAFPPQRLPDGKTFEVTCRTAPAARYALWFNHAPYLNFVSEAKMPAEPFELRFATAPR